MVNHKSCGIGRLSIRTYLILMSLILPALLFPSVIILFWNKSFEQHQNELTKTVASLRTSLQDRGVTVSRSISLSAKQALAGFDYTFLTNLVELVVANDKDIHYCMLVDTQGTVMIHSDPRNSGIFEPFWPVSLDNLSAPAIIK
ncbi:hypothetical protein CCP4SC76_1880003 [Gammaproteobacteria bacterium]